MSDSIVNNIPVKTRQGLHVGLTASRSRRPPTQMVVLKHYLQWFYDHGYATWHDGDCVGGDYQGHELAAEIGLFTVGHPPLETQYRGFADFDELRTPKQYLDRNKDIVEESDYMIALPDSPEERLRSGTWSTLRYARKISRPGCVIYPDGSVSMIVEALL